MNGAYILAGILLVFFIGCFSMIMDLIYNNEPEVILVRKPKPQPVSKLEDDYKDLDAVEDWEDLNTDSIRNS